MDSPRLIKGKKDKNIISNLVLWSRQDIAVTQERAETRDMEDNNKGGGPSLPTIILKLRAKKYKTITRKRGILTR